MDNFAAFIRCDRLGKDWAVLDGVLHSEVVRQFHLNASPIASRRSMLSTIISLRPLMLHIVISRLEEC